MKKQGQRRRPAAKKSRRAARSARSRSPLKRTPGPTAHVVARRGGARGLRDLLPSGSVDSSSRSDGLDALLGQPRDERAANTANDTGVHGEPLMWSHARPEPVGGVTVGRDVVVGDDRGVLVCACGFSSPSSAVMVSHVEDCPELQPAPAAAALWWRRALQRVAALFA